MSARHEFWEQTGSVIVIISSASSYSAAQTNSVTTRKPASTVESVSSSSASENQSESTQTISLLARQLADSAKRAEERDKTLSFSELGAKAKSLLSQISGDNYVANKAKHDSEVPNTSDPELLARAKQATAFVNDAANRGHSVRNPFAGLSQEQLANIIYDDSGTFTVNERRAAYYESYNQEEAWREQVCAQAMDEYNRTGKLTNFFSMILDHFKELPAIEKAQYPDNYASDLEHKINQDFNYRTNQAEGQGDGPRNLIEMLFNQTQKQKNQLSHRENSGNLVNPTITGS